MCLANDFAALSAPCGECVRVRPHIPVFPSHEFSFASKSLLFFKMFYIPLTSLHLLRLTLQQVRVQLFRSDSSDFSQCSVCTAVAFLGFLRLWRRFSLASRH